MTVGVVHDCRGALPYDAAHKCTDSAEFFLNNQLGASQHHTLHFFFLLEVAILGIYDESVPVFESKIRVSGEFKIGNIQKVGVIFNHLPSNLALIPC